MKSQQKFRYVIIGVVAFVLGFGLAWVSFRKQNSGILALSDNGDSKTESQADDSKDMNKDVNTSSDKQGENNKIKSGTQSGNNLKAVLSVDNQAPGKSVYIKDISSSEAVWVVIIEDIGGMHGNILGAGLFDFGESAGIVELLRGTVEGGTYYASIYTEDSDLEINRLFEIGKDQPLLDQGGNPVEVHFMTSSKPQ